MGLNFLNKKRIHPGSFGNIQKVWETEKKHLELERKEKERQKRLKEERQAEELLKLKVEAGIVDKSELEKLPFIYKEINEYSISEKPTNTINKSFDNKFNNIDYNEKTIEDYFKNDNNIVSKDSQLNNINSEKNLKNNRFSSIISNKNNNVCSKSEMFTRMNEDPLFKIKQEEHNRRKEVQDNPAHMKLILKQIEEQLLEEEDKVLSKIKKKTCNNLKDNSKKLQYKNEDLESKLLLNTNISSKYGLILNKNYLNTNKKFDSTAYNYLDLTSKIKEKEDLFKKYTTNYSNKDKNKIKKIK